MEDNNIMKVNKYLPKLPNGKEGSGYDNTYRQVIEPSFVRTQTAVDHETEEFKYGLESWERSGKFEYVRPLNMFQDPLFPIFDIVIDSTNSPLLTDVELFLNDYIGIYSIQSRIKIYDEFKKTLYTLFNRDFRSIERNKSYYINSIAGLDKLTARMVEFEKDKITINVNEDVSMMSMYLAHLYNNLSYSYRDQRQMIPANLLRFNMYIKIHDVRNMPFYIPDGENQITSFDKSYQIYLLRDCTFNFKNSKNFDDTITVGGFDAGAPTKPSSISIEVVYKSIEIESEYPLIRESMFDKSSSALKLNNKDKDVGLSSINDYERLSPLDKTIYNMNTIYMNHAKSPETLEEQILTDSKINNDANAPIESEVRFSPNLIQSFKRTKTITEIGKLPNDRSPSSKYIYVDPKQLEQYRIDQLNSSSDPEAYNYKSSGPDYIDPSELQRYREDTLNYYAYMADDLDPTDPNYVYRDPGLLNVVRNSLLNEINLSSYLMNLPYNIINLFFGDYHGMQTMYIPGSDTGPIYYGHRGGGGNGYIIGDDLPVLDGEIIEGSILGGVSPDPKDLNGLDITQEINSQNRLDGEIINNEPVETNNLDGEFIPFALRPPQKLDGEFIPFALRPPQKLDGEFIPFALRPPQKLDGEFIPFALRPPQELDGEFIPFALAPQILLSGFIDTSFKIKSGIEGVIDISFKVQPDLEGVIDTSFRIQPDIEGVIDTTIKERDVISGVIDTSIKQRDKLNGRIDTTIKERAVISGVIDTTIKDIPDIEGVIDTTIKERDVISGRIDTSIRDREFEMGRLYSNEYLDRVVNLGLLYVGIDKNNILPLTYLYSKVDNFQSIANYYVYNNSETEIKSLNNITIDQTGKVSLPLQMEYKYDNSLDLTKTFNNIFLYNKDINKINNLTAIDVISTNNIKRKFIDEVYSYDNTSSKKDNLEKYYLYTPEDNLNILKGEKLYDNTDIFEKSLNNLRIEQDYIRNAPSLNLGNVLTETPTKEVRIDLGTLYEPSQVKKLLVPNLLLEPIVRDSIDLGKIFDTLNIKPKNILKSIDEIEIESEIQKSRMEVNRIDQKIITKRPLSEQYIDMEENKDRDNLDMNDVVYSSEYDYKVERSDQRLNFDDDVLFVREIPTKRSLDNESVESNTDKKNKEKLDNASVYNNDEIKDDKIIREKYIIGDKDKDKDKEEKTLNGDTIFNQDMYKKDKEGLDNERLG